MSFSHQLSVAAGIPLSSDSEGYRENLGAQVLYSHDSKTNKTPVV